jgi:ribosomal protein S16
MADTDFNSAPNSSGVLKPHVYDLLNRLNAAFARVHRNMEALEQVGIFDPLMMQVLSRQQEKLRAGANYHLLGTMRRIEERDRERFSQPPNEETPSS